MRKAVLLTILVPAALQAQQVKPRLIFDVDTSGSMAWEACDPSVAGDVDHADDCPGVDVLCSDCNVQGCGDGIPNDGRLWKVKTAITDVVTAFGEVQFALARFASTPQTFSCKAGGWNGPGGFCVFDALGTGENAADILVEFSDDNQQDILDWLNFRSDYPNPGDLGPAPPTGCSLCADCAGGCDKELRPIGATPVAGSIVSCDNYLDGVRAADPQAACRPYGVILLSDGQETCGDPANPGDVNPAPEQAAALCDDGVPTHVIGFASPTIQTLLNQIADAGCGPGCDDPDNDGVANCSNFAVMVDNETDLALAFADIIQASIRFEKCNGLDDDCDCPGDTNLDGTVCGPGDVGVDEDFVTLGNGCGKGRCSGTVCCKTLVEDPTQTQTKCCGLAPTCEDCNRIDDDCDGVIDNNIDDLCDGVPGDDPPTGCVCFPEECNGYDDDCDCPGDTNGDGTSCGPGDLLVDEEPLITSGYPCGTDIGICMSGLTCCVQGVPECCGGVPPQIEQCDCMDNDCNGATDEGGFLPCFTLGDGCDPNAPDLSMACKGICKLGNQECDDGDPGPGCVAVAGECLGQRGPDPEACNCVDDDCDARIDEDVICSSGGRCENCGCPTDCNPTIEFPCPLGFVCECTPTADCDCTPASVGTDACRDNHFCQVDVCTGVGCEACKYCEPRAASTGDACVELCPADGTPDYPGQLACQPWEECRCSGCVDVSCTNPDEPTAQRCAENEVCNPVTHLCESDPCDPSPCGDGEYCRNDLECRDDPEDLCVPRCPACAELDPPRKCECGVCVEDLCAGVRCPLSGQVCCGGECINNPCTTIEKTCGPGQFCDPCKGQCVVDYCALGQFACGSEHVCEKNECLRPSEAERPRDQLSASGAGGCGCRVAASPGPSGLWVLLLGLAGLLWRRSCVS